MAHPDAIDQQRRCLFRKRGRSCASRTETDSMGGCCGGFVAPVAANSRTASRPSSKQPFHSLLFDSRWASSRDRSSICQVTSRDVHHASPSKDELISPSAAAVSVTLSRSSMARIPPARGIAAFVSLLLLVSPLPVSTFSVPLVLPKSSHATSTLVRLGVSRSASLVVNGTTSTVSSSMDLEGTTRSFGGTSTAQLDIPRPTPNGGFTHTQRSREKISLANKGKTPWNKGVNRSEEVKAKIAEGVRRRNRQRFLDKLASMNMTEEMWERHQADLQAQKERERLRRQTAQGGYRLSNETRQKISQVLKERYASGQIQRRAVDPDKVRKGFTHSAETRAKIAESLRRRWATDDRYRANMLRQSSSSASQLETRQKISNSLKQKWQDPEFRESMLAKMAVSKGNRSSTGSRSVTYDEDHRQRISEAMKAKWQDETYRAKTLEAIAKKRQAMMTQRQAQTSPSGQSANEKAATAAPVSSQKRAGRVLNSSKRPVTRSSTSGSGSSTNPVELVVVKPLEPKRAVTPRQRQRQGVTSSDQDRSHVVAGKDDSSLTSPASLSTRSASSSTGSAIEPSSEAVVETKPTTPSSSSTKAARKSKKESRDNTVEKHGSVAKLKQERRDLYDLLYGDDDNDEDSPIRLRDAYEIQKPRRAKKALHPSKDRDDDGSDELYDFDDENLDRFDPYGLDDF